VERKKLFVPAVWRWHENSSSVCLWSGCIKLR
jgi:hypothetical protein